jgi:hypothetical protein
VGKILLKIRFPSRYWRLIPVILGTEEAEIRRIEVRGQPR